MKEKRGAYFVNNLIRDFLPNSYIRLQNYYNNKQPNIKLIILLGVSLVLLVFSGLYTAYKKDIKYAKNIERLVKNSLNDKNNSLKYFTEIKDILSKKRGWQSYLYFSKTINRKNKYLVDQLINQYITLNSIPILVNYLENYILKNLDYIYMDQTIDAVKVYLMLIRNEPFDQKFVQKWYMNQYSHLINDENDINLVSIIHKLEPSFFASLPSKELYNNIINVLNNYNMSNDIYSSLVKQTESRFALEYKSFFSKDILSVFDKSIQKEKIPYIYSARGYKEYVINQEKALEKILKFHSFRKDLNLINILQIIQQTNSHYVSDYVKQWNDFFTKLSLKQINKLSEISEILNLLMINNFSLERSLQQIKNKMLPIEPQSALQEIVQPLPIDIRTTTDYDTIIQSIEKQISYDFDSIKTLSQLDADLAINVNKLIKEINIINLSTDNNKAAFQFISKYENTKDFVLNNLEATVSNLSMPVNKIYSTLLDRLKTILYKSSYDHVNHCWQAKIYDYYLSNIKDFYPFNNNNYDKPISLKTFINFFGPGGLIDNFTQEYLQLKDIILNEESENFLNIAEDIKKYWFNKDGQLQVKFDVIPTRMSSNLEEVTLNMLGQKLTFNTQILDTGSFKWPPSDLLNEHIKIEFSDVDKKKMGIVYGGLWGWYRFLGLDKDISEALPPRTQFNKTISASVGRFDFLIEFENELTLLHNDLSINPTIIQN